MGEDTTMGDTTVTGITITTDTDTMAVITITTDTDIMVETDTVLHTDSMDIIEMPTIIINTEEDNTTIYSTQRCVLCQYFTHTL